MRASKLSAAFVSGGRPFAAIGGLIIFAVTWTWPLRGLARDLFAVHMFQHLLVMNVAAPLIAVSLQRLRIRDDHAARRWSAALPAVTALQLAALWMWHMPAVFAAGHHSPSLQVLMQLSLFIVAASFWTSVLECRDHAVWRPIFALLVTAKIFCLLGAAFVFTRRPLYPPFGGPETWGLSALEDQQLAGLLMVSSCAVVYVAAAIALFARWLATAEALRDARPRWTHGPDAEFVSK